MIKNDDRKYCVIKDTTKEINSHNPIEIMLENAHNAGFEESEIEIITEEEYRTRKDLEPKPLIVNELEEVKQALAELTILISMGGMQNV